MKKPTPMDCSTSETGMCSQFYALVQQHVAYGLLPPACIIHIPNGQRAGSSFYARQIAGSHDKAMGVHAGTPDYLVRLPGARIGWLEAKRYVMGKDGKITKTYPTDEQRAFMEQAETRGEKTAVFRTPGEGIEILKEWFLS